MNLKRIFNVVIWLAGQGLAFRKGDESKFSINRGNFLEQTEYTGDRVPEFIANICNCSIHQQQKKSS
jgi:hypothetical protein